MTANITYPPTHLPNHNELLTENVWSNCWKHWVIPGSQFQKRLVPRSPDGDNKTNAIRRNKMLESAKNARKRWKMPKMLATTRYNEILLGKIDWNSIRAFEHDFEVEEGFILYVGIIWGAGGGYVRQRRGLYWPYQKRLVPRSPDGDNKKITKN